MQEANQKKITEALRWLIYHAEGTIFFFRWHYQSLTKDFNTAGPQVNTNIIQNSINMFQFSLLQYISTVWQAHTQNTQTEQQLPKPSF
jgi:hypothetical protein